MDVGDLYGLPLDRFVPERAAQVRALRSAGEREQATAVAALRKPSVAAWAVNQLIRTQRGEVQALLDAGDALRDAQADVLAGGADAQDLRSAAERERTAVDGLVSTARGLLSSSGQELSAATLERVADTLHAAALDDEAREQVIEGRLVRELRHVGLGGGLGLVAPARAAQPARPRTSRIKADAEAAKDRRAAKAEAAERREQEAARKQARANERDAAREVERAERSRRAAQERRNRAAEALAQAEDALADAQAGHEAALAAHRQARQQLENL